MASSPFARCMLLVIATLVATVIGRGAPPTPARLENGDDVADSTKSVAVSRQLSDLSTLREFERASESEAANDTVAVQEKRQAGNKTEEKRHTKKRALASNASAAKSTAPRGSLRSRMPSMTKAEVVDNKTALNFTKLEVSSPFVKLTDNVTKETGETEIVAASIASPSTILSTFILIYVPLAMAWSFYFHHGQQQVHYALLLPVTYCLIQIGQDLVNQSLALALKSPMAITLLQSGAMMLITGAWALVTEVRTVLHQGFEPLRAWMPTALLFAVYQLVNHLVWWRCSLSERTVFTNITPAATLVFELFLLPPTMKGGPPSSFRARMAIALMVAGAVLFSIQYPDFTFAGISVASLMVITTVPYRLSQRFYFSQRPQTPIGFLCFIDSFILFGPAFTMSKSNLDHFWATLFMWFEQPSIVIMLVSSIFAFTAHHVTSLMMLREGSATSYLVFNNIANFAVVGMGIAFFGDKVMQTPLVLTGLAICLGSGLWYAVEVQPSGTWEALRGAVKLHKSNSFPFLAEKQCSMTTPPMQVRLPAATHGH